MQKLNGTLYIDADVDDFNDAVGRCGARNLLMKPTLHLKHIHFRISFKGLKRLILFTFSFSFMVTIWFFGYPFLALQLFNFVIRDSKTSGFFSINTN